MESMEWFESWSKENPKDLAHYVVPKWAAEIAQMNFEFNLEDAMKNLKGRRKIIEGIYNRLVEWSPSIQYALEDYTPIERIQIIRSPEEVLGPPQPKGTCLDLSILFCGLCLENNLLPLLVIMQGHAFVIVSSNFVLRNEGKSSWKNPDYDKERNHIHKYKGMLRLKVDFKEESERNEDLYFLRERINSGDFIPVECTGFAHTETLDKTMPEGIGRIDGFLPFERAVEAGKEQFERRTFQYALDICYLQNKASIKPYQKPKHMSIEIAKLASLIVGSLLTPYLKKGKDKFIEEIGGEAGEKSASLAADIWKKVKAIFGSDKDKQRIEKFEKAPEEKEAFITELLEEKLEEDKQLAQELEEQIRKLKTSDGKSIMQVFAHNVINFKDTSIGGHSIVGGIIGSISSIRSKDVQPTKDELKN